MMRFWNDAGAFVSPNGMTRYSNQPYRVRKAVFHSSPSAMGFTEPVEGF